jgi:hypothetical protein
MLSHFPKLLSYFLDRYSDQSFAKLLSRGRAAGSRWLTARLVWLARSVSWTVWFRWWISGPSPYVMNSVCVHTLFVTDDYLIKNGWLKYHSLVILVSYFRLSIYFILKWLTNIVKWLIWNSWSKCRLFTILATHSVLIHCSDMQTGLWVSPFGLCYWW